MTFDGVFSEESKFLPKKCLNDLQVHSHLRFTQLLRLNGLIIKQRIGLYQVGTFTLVVGVTTAITMQEIVRAIVHEITIDQ